MGLKAGKQTEADTPNHTTVIQEGQTAGRGGRDAGHGQS